MVYHLVRNFMQVMKSLTKNDVVQGVSLASEAMKIKMEDHLTSILDDGANHMEDEEFWNMVTEVHFTLFYLTLSSKI